VTRDSLSRGATAAVHVISNVPREAPHVQRDRSRKLRRRASRCAPGRPSATGRRGPPSAITSPMPTKQSATMCSDRDVSARNAPPPNRPTTSSRSHSVSAPSSATSVPTSARSDSRFTGQSWSENRQKRTSAPSASGRSPTPVMRWFDGSSWTRSRPDDVSDSTHLRDCVVLLTPVVDEQWCRPRLREGVIQFDGTVRERRLELTLSRRSQGGELDPSVRSRALAVCRDGHLQGGRTVGRRAPRRGRRVGRGWRQRVGRRRRLRRARTRTSRTEREGDEQPANDSLVGHRRSVTGGR